MSPMNHRLLRPRRRAAGSQYLLTQDGERLLTEADEELMTDDGVGFDPRSISGLEAWWDFSDASTLYSDDAATTLTAVDGQIAVCVDKSGLGRNLSQTTANNRPLRRAASQAGRDAAEFDGSNDTLTVASSPTPLRRLHYDDNTVLVALKPGVSSDPNEAYAFLANTTSPGVLFYYDDRSIFSNNDKARYISQISSGNFAVNAQFQDALPGNQWSIVSYVNKPTDATPADRSTIRIGKPAVSQPNTNSGSPVNSDSGDLIVGVGGGVLQNQIWFKDRIGEMLIYSRALSDSEEAAVRLYLLAKWGL